VKLWKADHYETELIFSALLDMLAKSPARQMSLAVPAVARQSLYAAREAGRLYIYGDYGILVDVGSPWHTNERVLIEEIIIRFRRFEKNGVEGAIDQLQHIAKEHGCAAIAAGDTQVGIMTPRYLAAGFKTLGTQFFMEVQ
jgi:hypothetical protein